MRGGRSSALQACLCSCESGPSPQSIPAASAGKLSIEQGNSPSSSRLEKVLVRFKKCFDNSSGTLDYRNSTGPLEMNLSKRSEYALRALIDLGIARELGRPILQVTELASKEKLPIKFLEQILTQLRLAGYVETKRGKFGGYSLAKPAARIKLGAVIRVLDGPLAPIACVSQTAYHRCTCPDEAHCGLRMLMLDVRNAIARILDRSTLAQIVEITLRKMRRDKIPVPFARGSFGLEEAVALLRVGSETC
jgi:Rrf2 family protein